MQAQLEQAFAELVLAERPLASDPEALVAWASRHGLERDEAEWLGQQGAERLLVYRKLVRSTLAQAIQDVMPRTRARLGPIFEEYFARFLSVRASRSHYLRDVASELLDFCEPLWAGDARVPPWLKELGRHEALTVTLAAMPPAERGNQPGPLTLDRPLSFVESAHVACYRHAVHELPSDPDDRSTPPQRPTALFAYRDAAHEVRWLELTPLAASILQRLLAGATLEAAVRGACDESGAGLDAAVIDGTARLLADLGARGAMLGAAPCASSASEDA